MSIDCDRLWRQVIEQFALPRCSIHGPLHWHRVEQNGLLLATNTAADVDVVRLFAVFHDSRRETDSADPEHGARGAELAARLRGVLFDVSDVRFDLLRVACADHTSGLHHDDPTIATCWDADRLDLGRVGRVPDPSFMSTDTGRRIADAIRVSTMAAVASHPRHRGAERLSVA
jgi:uncharacterized protein